MNIENQPEEVIKLTLGQRLKQARKALGMSQGDVAVEQCLRLTIIRDIEADINNDKVPDVFWRGYIRAYARQVNISDEELSQYFSDIKPGAESKRTNMRNFSQKGKTKKRDKWLMVLTAIILLVTLGFSGVWWWQKHRDKQLELADLIEHSALQGSSQTKSALQPQTHPQQSGDIDSASTPEQALPQTEQPSVSGSETVDSQPSTSSVSTPVTSRAPALVINFKDDSWIEVINSATNEVVYSGLRNKGQHLIYNNDVAYYLKIGAPTGVEVLHHNKKVDLRAFIKQGSTVAHVNLTANN